MIRLSLAASLTLTLTLVLGAGACSTDTKNANVTDASSASSSAATASDAGVLAAAAVNSTDLDAGLPPDAGDLAPDAGANPVTTASVTTTTTTNDGGGGGGGGVKPMTAESTAFDRILVKPKTPGGDPETFKAAVEKKTGHKVAMIRKALAGKWFLVQFAPTSKARTADDQAKLVDVIKSMEDIATAEGDRMVKPK